MTIQLLTKKNSQSLSLQLYFKTIIISGWKLCVFPFCLASESPIERSQRAEMVPKMLHGWTID